MNKTMAPALGNISVFTHCFRGSIYIFEATGQARANKGSYVPGSADSQESSVSEATGLRFKILFVHLKYGHGTECSAKLPAFSGQIRCLYLSNAPISLRLKKKKKEDHVFNFIRIARFSIVRFVTQKDAFDMYY